jgi:hypothetical protein
MEQHTKRKHAILSASGSDRWFNCTPSARLEDEHGVRTTSVFAEEGTTAHELADLMLSRDVLGDITEDKFVEQLTDIMNKPSYNDEMLVEVPKYVEYCVAQFNAAKVITPDALIAVEQKIDLRAYIPDGFGTDDCIIIADGVMEVIDLKYGKGVAVSATANKQLMLYGLGALEKFAFMYDITEVKLTIVQPRMDSVSSWTISVDDILVWANTELMVKASMAYKGEGELAAGSWCKFCAIKNKCPKLAETNLDIAKHEFAKPQFLSDEAIAEILIKVPMLVEWANGIAEWACNEAANNAKVWPGFKLVEGISRRKWVDEVTATKAIQAHFPGCEDNDIFNTKLKSITDIEKLVSKKKFTEVLSHVVVKPQGKPTLVPLTDNRTPMGLDQAIKDFA